MNLRVYVLLGHMEKHRRARARANGAAIGALASALLPVFFLPSGNSVLGNPLLLSAFAVITCVMVAITCRLIAIHHDCELRDLHLHYERELAAAL